MLVWLTLPFYDFCGFRSVAVNSVYKLQFFTFIYIKLNVCVCFSFLMHGHSFEQICMKFGKWDPYTLQMVMEKGVLASAARDRGLALSTTKLACTMDRTPYPVNNDGWAIIDSIGVMLAQPSSFCANVGPTITSQRSLRMSSALAS